MRGGPTPNPSLEGGENGKVKSGSSESSEYSEYSEYSEKRSPLPAHPLPVKIKI